MADTLQGLNPQQQEAVRTINGPMLIMAGAGSGKTKVLTCRVAHLLNQGVKPWRILAITFTNKAAGEMRERVDRMAGAAAKDVWLFTFHAFCARLLRMDIDKMPGYTSNFAIYDTTDTRNLMKQILKELNLDDKRYQPATILANISNAKNAMQTPDTYAQSGDAFFDRKMAEIYDIYQKRLRANNALDFDDLLFVALRLLQTNEEVRQKYQDKFDYIMVDEYQDTNHAQYLLTKILAAKHRNICVVGDADQSIYGWRGADIRNIQDFEKDYPDAKVIKLEQNYRSTQVILDAANAVIANNTGRKPKNLWTDNGTGSEIVYYHAPTDRDEASFVIEQMRDLQAKAGAKLGDMAVLYRTNSQSRIFEEMLIKSGIGYSIVGGTKFYERMEIKDIISYLRVLYNPNDSLSLLRIVNVPKRGIGPTTIEKVAAFANANGMALFEALSNASEVPGLTSRVAGKLDDLSATLFELMGDAAEMPVEELLEAVLDKTGYMAELEASDKDQDKGRIENLKELLSVASEFEEKAMRNGDDPSLENFLADVALVADIDSADLEEDTVTLMTLHSAKGLEFPNVFLVGLEEGIFPTARATDYSDAGEEALEEERRLMYVGITRAEKRLYLTDAAYRMLYGKTQIERPSRFLEEVPRNLIHVYKRAGFVSGRGGVQGSSVRREQLGSRPSTQQPVTSAAKNWFMPKTNFMPQGTSVNTSFKPGDHVRHAKFGEGTVVSATTTSDGQEVKIAFAGGGIRSLLTKFAKLEKI